MTERKSRETDDELAAETVADLDVSDTESVQGGGPHDAQTAPPSVPYRGAHGRATPC